MNISMPLFDISCRPLKWPNDLSLIYSWVTSSKAAYWGLQDARINDINHTYDEILKTAHVFIGLVQGKPQFLFESYDPKNECLDIHYDYKFGDKGIHILIAPTESPIKGFSEYVMRFVLEFHFNELNTSRIIVEPDCRNNKIHKLNKKVGFNYFKTVNLPNKRAFLAILSKHNYQPRNLNKGTINNHSRRLYDKANRHMLAKLLSEGLHERLLKAQPHSKIGSYICKTDYESIFYTFDATILPLDHWVINPNSITKSESDNLDVLSAVIEFKHQLNINPSLIPTYIEEIQSTLSSLFYKFKNTLFSSQDLLHADFQVVESSMTEGHPSFIANNGRIGFTQEDYLTFAPETGTEFSLVWVATHKNNTEFTCFTSISYQDIINSSLSEREQSNFNRQLKDLDLNPSDYILFPVHPWQWRNKLSIAFADEILKKNFVYLGKSIDQYQAQQSIRTLFNKTQPTSPYIKVALSILNMGFVRGLSPDYMQSTPPINQWLYNLIQHDQYLQTLNFKMLREVASIGYRHPIYENCDSKTNPYKKMMAALWRESPVPLVHANQRIITMAALLHKDTQGVSFVKELILASNKSIDDWIYSYLEVYLKPILHCFFKYELVFMPHGENVILVLEDFVPTSIFMKDIGEEIVVMGDQVDIPKSISRIKMHIPCHLKILSILIDVFDSFFRYLSQYLYESMKYPATHFWQLVASCIRDYQSSHPEFKKQYEKYDLFTDKFELSCLNRLQLSNNQHMLNLDDQAAGLQFSGYLKNPISPFKNVDESTHSF